MPKKLKWKDVREVSIVDAGANLKGPFPITKGLKMKERLEAALETPVAGEDEIKKGAANVEQADALVAAYRIADALGVKDVVFAPAKEPEAPVVPETPEVETPEVNKNKDDENMNEEIKKQFESLQKQLDTEKEARELVEQKLLKARDDADLAGWVQKAKDNLAFLPGTFEDHATELHAVAKIDAELAEKQFARLCETAKLVEKSGAFNTVGTRGAKEVPASERISKKADELRKDSDLSGLEALKQAALEAEKE